MTLGASGASQYFPRVEAKAEYDSGLALQKAGNAAAALDSFGKAVRLDPDYMEACLALANAAKAAQSSRQGAGSQAKPASDTTLSEFRTLYAGLAAASPNKAIYQWALGQFDDSETQEDAERYFRKAVALDATFVPAYLSLATTLTYRGDLAGARECLQKAFELRPPDRDALAVYAQRVGESDFPLYCKLTDDFITRFPGDAAGFELLSRMAVYEGNLTARIADLERLKNLYPPDQNNNSEWYMRFLFDAYNRTNPPKALSLAQEMSVIIRVRQVQREWQDLMLYEQNLIAARGLMDRHLYAKAADQLNGWTAPYPISSDPQSLLQADALAKAGKSKQAYTLLVSAMAAEPSDAVRPVLLSYGNELKKTPAQVEQDVWSRMGDFSSSFKNFTLSNYQDGKQVQLSDYRGRVVLVDFWDPMSGACREDFPRLQKALDKYGTRGLTIITINVRPAQDAIAAVLMGRYGFVALRVPDGQWALKNYHIDTTPTNILIDRRGRALFQPAFWGFDPQHTFELLVETLLSHGAND
jgi:tetratricopeptide (TPR) repeat protein